MQITRLSLCLTVIAVGVASGVFTSPVFGQNSADSPPAPVNSLEPRFVVSTKHSDLKITERFSKVVEAENRIKFVDGFDPEVINVTALAPDQVRVQAVKPGITTMVLTDEVGEVFSVEVMVLGDVRHLQAYINKLFPRAKVDAVAVQETVVLRGWVEQPEHITEIMEIASRFYAEPINQMKVGGGQTIALKVQVMEVQRSKIRQLGFNFLYIGENGFASSTPGGLTPINALSTGNADGGLPELAVNAQRLVDLTSAFGIVRDSFTFQGFLEALKREALLKILAEPRLITTNGRPANMLAGGEFPILVPQSLGTVTIEWREFGVRLEAVPIILGQGRVRLRLQPEVSERDFANSVSVNGLTVPGLTTRRVNTEVEMRFGETYMLAGLLRFTKNGETSKTPILGELPLVGAAFRRVRYEESETELVIMVTPELVSPMEPCQVPAGGPGRFTAVPTDRELYLDGMLEVPNYGEPCADCVAPNVHDVIGQPSARIHHVVTGPEAKHGLLSEPNPELDPAIHPPSAPSPNWVVPHPTSDSSTNVGPTPVRPQAPAPATAPFGNPFSEPAASKDDSKDRPFWGAGWNERKPPRGVQPVDFSRPAYRRSDGLGQQSPTKSSQRNNSGLIQP